MENVSNWMSWEGGVDLVALTQPDLQMPNLIIHLGRIVHTPVGSAPAGMILWQPDAGAAPVVFGFVCSDPVVGAYFGPKIFAGTPFEQAPVLPAAIHVEMDETKASVSCETSGYLFEVTMRGSGNPRLINRAPAAMPPFHQQGVEITMDEAIVKINGQQIPVIIPPLGISGGPACVVSPNGVYAR